VNKRNSIHLKNTAIDHLFLVFPDTVNTLKPQQLARPFTQTKLSANMNFLFSFSSLLALNKGIFHDITMQNYNNRTIEKPMWNLQEQ